MNDAPAPLIDSATLERLERNFGRALLTTRWLVAPIYLGLLASVVLLGVKFVQKFIEGVRHVLHVTTTEEMLDILQLVDIALVANLVLVVAFAG
jgi:uncharacterized protein (TIGR00645 family)